MFNSLFKPLLVLVGIVVLSDIQNVAQASITSSTTKTPSPYIENPLPAITVRPRKTEIAEPAKLAECQAFANQFKITDTRDILKTNSKLASLSFMKSQKITCSGMTQCQQNGKTTSGCSWNRKLRVSCESQNNKKDVYIRVQTNSLPDHCFVRDSSSFPIENYIDFQVKYDVSPTLLSTASFSNSSKAESALCNNKWSRSQFLKGQVQDLNIKSGVDLNVVGVLFNGVVLFSGYSDKTSYDALQSSSQSRTNATQLDSCLGGYDSQGFYRYFSYSPCVKDQTYKTSLTTPALCKNTANCNTNAFSFALDKTTTTNKVLQPLGIAKDGHKILGPYKNDGSLWQPCEVDVCNGVTINGSYYYVMTSFYPYTIGCWGPAEKTSYTLTCTTNRRVCTNKRNLNNEDILYSSALNNQNIFSGLILSFLTLVVTLGYSSTL
eukprot:403359465